MARSIKEIKDAVAAEFMANRAAAERYGFEAGTAFGDFFGAASVESILLYVWAVCAHVAERLLDTHRAEVERLIETRRPHRTKWYRDRVLEFMAGRELDGDTGAYDTSGMGEGEVAAARVVRHAVAVESADSGLLTIKVAGESGGRRGPLPPGQERQLRAYIAEIKDAGVRTALVNAEPDTLECTADVYYDALMDPAGVRDKCVEAIRSYVENLPFNGEYTNMALVDALQGVAGVRVAELKGSRAKAAGDDAWTAIDARHMPRAGYFAPGAVTVNMREYGG